MSLASLFGVSPLLAQEVTRTTFEFGRIQSNADYVLPVAVFLAAGLFVGAMYRRDAVELPRLLTWLLVALRTGVFLGLLILYLQPQWRVEHEVVHNSRALVLVDTSLSMGLTDEEPSGAKQAKSRIEQVAAALADSDLVARLRETHDVLVFRFNEGLDHDRVTLDRLGTARHPAEGATPNSAEAAASPTDDPETVDWLKFLQPDGVETQLGTALSQLIHDESGSPLSGIIVLTDGGQNAGVAPEAAIELAAAAKIPVFPVGVGSDSLPANVRVSDMVAPARAYPGDNYTVTGYVQAQGMAGKVVEVQLLSRPSTEGGEPGSGQIEARHDVPLGKDGEAVPVKFELTPQELGRRTLCFRVRSPQEDRNPGDDLREVEIEVVDRKNHVMIIAGGPTREYRFVRTMLFRDRSTTLDVLLQTAQPGIAQESDKLLDDFPTTRTEMYDYDCVVAFDPDWRALSVEQVGLLETWVAEKGGGLIVVAGPVYTGRTVGGWVEDKDMAPIRALYPVEFQRRFSVLEDRVETSAEPWPLEFSREGLEAEYLWLADTATAGREVWAGFPGVFSYCPVRGPKPGATVLARFSDPRAGSGGQLPAFFVSQFYGSGRVFYIASGELWRLRMIDSTYFEQFYTKVIRHVSQGRLLRQSSRGVLLVGQDRYLVGNTVEVRAQLTDVQLDPLEAPDVPLEVVRPDRSVQTVVLQADPNRVGTYAGRFPVLDEGTYQLDLAVPESEDEHLARRIQVDVPDLEREDPQRNDALLSRIAQGTGGTYYDTLNGALGTASNDSLVAGLKDRSQTVIFTAAPNPLWEQTWLTWMMLALCGLLCVEWLIRRLAKLA